MENNIKKEAVESNIHDSARENEIVDDEGFVTDKFKFFSFEGMEREENLFEMFDDIIMSVKYKDTRFVRGMRKNSEDENIYLFGQAQIVHSFLRNKKEGHLLMKITLLGKEKMKNSSNIMNNFSIYTKAL